jgi:hypothetical protein
VNDNTMVSISVAKRWFRKADSRADTIRRLLGELKQAEQDRMFAIQVLYESHEHWRRLAIQRGERLRKLAEDVLRVHGN